MAFFFNPRNFVGVCGNWGKIKLDKWPVQRGWLGFLLFVKLCPLFSGTIHFGWLRHFGYHFSGDEIVRFILKMTVNVDILRKVSLHLDVPGS